MEFMIVSTDLHRDSSRLKLGSATTTAMTRLAAAVAAMAAMSRAAMAQTETSSDDPGAKKARQNQGIFVPFVLFATVGLACMLLFCVVRTWFVDIYSPRRALSRGQPPRIRKGFFTWIPVVYSAKETFLINTVGLDGVMFLRFLKMGYRIFGLFTLLGLGIVAPVNFYAYPPTGIANATGYQIEDMLLPALSVDNVPNRSDFLIVHLAMTWIFSLVAIGYIIAYYRGYVLLKLHYDEHALRQTRMSKIDMRSVMVFGIPRELRNEVDLASYFESLGIGHVENAVICRNWSLLRAAIQKRAAVLVELERVYALAMHRRDAQNRSGAILDTLLSPVSGSFSAIFRSVFGTGARPSVSTSARGRTRDPRHGSTEPASYGSFSGHSEGSHFSQPRHRFTLNESMDQGVYEILSRIDAIDPRLRPTHRTGFLGLFGSTVDSAEYYAALFQEWDNHTARLRRTPERSAATAVGIVTFESPESATLATQVVLHRRPFACMSKMAPEPRDIYWPNLSSKSASNYTKLIRGLAVVICMFSLVFFSTFIVSTIAGLIDLDQLEVYLPVLRSLLRDLPDTWIQFIQGVIPASLLALWTSSLPSLLLLLSQAQGIEAVSWIEMSLLTKYFFYQLWNVLFVTVFARALVYEIIPNPQKVIELLGQMVPKASTTLINYVILQGVAVAPAQLLLVAPLALTWLFRLFPWSRSTPRQVSDAYYPSILTCINYGVSYPVPILVFIIGVVYAPIAPLVLPFCFLFFAIVYGVYKYMFMYVHLPRYESKGMAAVYAINRCLYGLVIMQLTMMGLLALKASGDPPALMSTPVSTPQASGAFESGRESWSTYAQMVVGVSPLLLITALVCRWLSQGYAKLVTNTPMEILGKVALELESERASAAQTAAYNRHARIRGSGSTSSSSGPVSGHGRNSIVGIGANSSTPFANVGIGGVGSVGKLQRIPTPTSQDVPNTAGRELNDFSQQSKLKQQQQHQAQQQPQQQQPHHQQQQSSSNLPLRADHANLMVPKVRKLSAMHSFGRQTLLDVTLDQATDQDRRLSLAETYRPSQPLAYPNNRHAGSGVSAIAASSAPSFTALPDPSATSPDMPDPTVAAGYRDQLGQYAQRKISTSSLLGTRLSVFEHIPDELSPFSPVGVHENMDSIVSPTQTNGTVSVPADYDEEASREPLLPSEGYETPISLDAHLEPPMTRVPGVLDASVDAASAVLRYGDEFDLDYDPHGDDMLLRTYLHPALIGRLPMAWLDGKQQPPRIMEAREELVANQRKLWQRMVSKQRVGVQVAVQDYMQQQQRMNIGSNQGSGDVGGNVRGSVDAQGGNGGGSNIHGNGGSGDFVEDAFLHSRIGAMPSDSDAVFGRFRSFIDGFASWVHMTIG